MLETNSLSGASMNEPVTEAELAVLECLWELGPSHSGQVRERLYPEGTSSDYSTLQKLLHRLEKKGLISRDRSQAVHIIEAVVSREEYAGERLAELATKLSDGSLSPLFMHLVENEKLSDSDLQSLRKLVRRSKGRRK
jgi:BlaI family penicillinase repressor